MNKSTSVLFSLLLCSFQLHLHAAASSPRCGDKCLFQLCRPAPVSLSGAADKPATSAICVNGQAIGVANSGEAFVHVPSKPSPLTKFSRLGLPPSVFKTLSLRNSSAAVAHQTLTPAMQAALAGRCVVLPLKNVQFLHPVRNSNLRGMFVNCLSFSTLHGDNGNHHGQHSPSPQIPSSTPTPVPSLSAAATTTPTPVPSISSSPSPSPSPSADPSATPSPTSSPAAPNVPQRRFVFDNGFGVTLAADAFEVSSPNGVFVPPDDVEVSGDAEVVQGEDDEDTVDKRSWLTLAWEAEGGVPMRVNLTLSAQGTRWFVSEVHAYGGNPEGGFYSAYGAITMTPLGFAYEGDIVRKIIDVTVTIKNATLMAFPPPPSPCVKGSGPTEQFVLERPYDFPVALELYRYTELGQGFSQSYKEISFHLIARHRGSCEWADLDPYSFSAAFAPEDDGKPARLETSGPVFGDRSVDFSEVTNFAHLDDIVVVRVGFSDTTNVTVTVTARDKASGAVRGSLVVPVSGTVRLFDKPYFWDFL